MIKKYLTKNNALIAILIFGIVLVVQAKEDGGVSGIITDAATGEPLPGANVFIADTFIGSSTDAEGRFVISGLQPGEYILKAGYIGYKVVERAVRISVGQVLSINLELNQTVLVGEQIVITSSRQPENLASAAGSINLIGKNELARRNSFRLDEALLSVPGVTMVGENINIRGGSGYNRLGGSRTLILLDGVPILTSDLSDANWNILPVTEVEHIEVSKGASSSLYGSGALSGVVNIITKQASEEHSFSFKQTSGIYDRPSVPEWQWTENLLYYNKTDISYSKSIGQIGVRLAMTRHASTGDRQNGRFERWHFTGKVSAQLPGNSNLTFFSTYSEEDRGLFLQWLEQDRALNVPSYDRDKIVGLNGYVGYAVFNKLFSPTTAFKARVSYNQQLVGVPFDLSGVFAPAIGLGSEMQLNYKPHQDHSLSMGLDYKYDTVESTYYGDQSANGVSPYILEIWKLTNLVHLNAGLRWDNYILVGDSVETQISPKVGFSWQPRFGTVLHGSIGRAFRAASVVERFLAAGSSDFEWRPNPGLKPERSTLLDVGLRQNIGDHAYAEAALFYNTFDGLIEPTLFTDLSAQFINYPRSRIQGVETEFRWRFWQDRIQLNASATWMDHMEIDSGQPLVYRPNFIAFVSPGFWNGPFGVEMDFRFMDRLQKVAIYPLDERVPTKLFDLRFNYMWKKLNFQLLVRNVLNYNHTVSERVLGEIRNVAVAITGSL